MYIYFVSFAHSNGFGNIEMESPRRIAEVKDTRRLEGELMRVGFKGVTILYFHLLRQH